MPDTRRKGPHHWIPLSFLAVAALLAELARERGGVWWALLWAALDCAAVGAAYFSMGGRVFGKRADGSMSGLAAAALLPFLFVLRATWLLQVLLSPEAASDEVAPALWVGRRPRRGELPPGTRLVVDLTSEFPRPGWLPPEVAYRTLPTLDAFVPGEEDFARLAAEVVAVSARPPGGGAQPPGGPALIYCANGHGRSAMFAAAVLVRRGLAADVETAEALICAARPACALNPAQRDAARRAGGRMDP